MDQKEIDYFSEPQLNDWNPAQNQNTYQISLFLQDNEKHNISHQIIAQLDQRENLLIQSQRQKISADRKKTNLQRKRKAYGLQKNKIDYQKNVLANIAKKCVQQFLSSSHKARVIKYCKKQRCNYDNAIDYYTKLIPRIYGVNFMGQLLIPKTEEEAKWKKVFNNFLIWFLRNKYTLLMFMGGKMKNKELYVDYKNKYLLYGDSIILIKKGSRRT